MEVLAFSSEYNTILNSIENVCRRINNTCEKGSHVPELTRCASLDALEHCHQRLRTILCERLREAVREAQLDQAHRELVAAPIPLSGPSETTASPDVCDKVIDRVELQLLSALRNGSLDDNHQRRVTRGGSIERAVSWKGNLAAFCVIPGRHDADGRKSRNEGTNSGSTFTKPGHAILRKLRKLRGQFVFTTAGAAADLCPRAKLVIGDSRRCKSVC